MARQRRQNRGQDAAARRGQPCRLVPHPDPLDGVRAGVNPADAAAGTVCHPDRAVRQQPGTAGGPRQPDAPAPARYGWPRHGTSREVERGILRQHGTLEPLQVRARLDAELLHQYPAGRLVGRKRIGLPPAAVEGDHQLPMQPFPQRVRGGQRLKLADHLGMTAERQIGVDPVLEDTDAQLLQPRDLRLRERFIAQVGEWRAAPEREGLVELVRRLPQLVRRQRLPSQPGQALEPVDIEFVRPHLQAVRAWAGRQQLPVGGLLQRLAQPRNIHLQGMLRACRRMLAPK